MPVVSSRVVVSVIVVVIGFFRYLDTFDYDYDHAHDHEVRENSYLQGTCLKSPAYGGTMQIFAGGAHLL